MPGKQLFLFGPHGVERRGPHFYVHAELTLTFVNEAGVELVVSVRDIGTLPQTGTQSKLREESSVPSCEMWRHM